MAKRKKLKIGKRWNLPRVRITIERKPPKLQVRRMLGTAEEREQDPDHWL